MLELLVSVGQLSPVQQRYVRKRRSLLERHVPRLLRDLHLPQHCNFLKRSRLVTTTITAEEDLVAGLELGDTRANGLDDAGALGAEHGRPALHHHAVVEALPVERVEANGFDADGDLMGCGGGRGDCDEGEGTALLGDLVPVDC